jgi:uncharacterized protein CbrC (UPF0167 family)
MAQHESAASVALQLKSFTEDIVQQITLEVTAVLGEDTPVDTGWAQANWVPNIGSSHVGTVGTKESVTATAKEEGIAKVLALYKLPAIVFVSNNVPYIERLNSGHSTQQPNPFVQLSILKGLQAVEKRV